MNMISKVRDAAFHTIDDIADLLQITNKAVRNRIARGGGGKDIDDALGEPPAAAEPPPLRPPMGPCFCRVLISSLQTTAPRDLQV